MGSRGFKNSGRVLSIELPEEAFVVLQISQDVV
jgi:hypothetical protein